MSEAVFLSLVRIGTGTNDASGFSLPESVDWKAVVLLASNQGLLAVFLDGYNAVVSAGSLPEGRGMPREMLLKAIGSVANQFEGRYVVYERALGELAAFYNTHGFKMMVLKGYVCSLDWPVPPHRPCGDIDIWLFGRYKEADAVLSREKGIKVDDTYHHHTVFDVGGVKVENHFDFVNVHHHKSSAQIEKVFKDLAMDDSHSIEVLGAKVYVPSVPLHALFLIRHALAHFAAQEINLRQVLDWGLYIKHHGDKLDWDWLKDMLDRFHMRMFFDCLNAICIDDLGFAPSLFPPTACSAQLKSRVLSDILFPPFAGQMPVSFFPRIIWKFKRWKANAWKHRICYAESMWSAFWSGVWSHLLKPSSI